MGKIYLGSYEEWFESILGGVLEKQKSLQVHVFRNTPSKDKLFMRTKNFHKQLSSSKLVKGKKQEKGQMEVEIN